MRKGGCWKIHLESGKLDFEEGVGWRRDEVSSDEWRGEKMMYVPGARKSSRCFFNAANLHPNTSTGS